MDNIQEININGYDTYYTQKTDNHGNYLLIAIPQDAHRDISDICGTIVMGHLIKEINYCTMNDVKFIKAYY